MEKLLDITVQNRKILYKILTETPLEQLLEIPKGFKNNIWWNIVHVLVTQQLLVYKLSDLQMRIDDELVEKFKKGTFPDSKVTEEDIKKVGALLLSALEWTKEDYKKGLFKSFQEYTTSVNITLRNVDDSMAFNVYHEGLHMGAILSLQKALAK